MPGRDGPGPLLSQGRSDIDFPSQGFVDAKGDPGQQPILHPASKFDVLHDRISDLGTVSEELVVFVQGEFGLVFLVDAVSLDLVDKGLVKVDHSNVRGRRAKNSSVRLLNGVGVYQDVDVGCAARIVTREECVEVGDTLMIGLLKATQERGVRVGVGGVMGWHARVDACRVAA